MRRAISIVLTDDERSERTARARSRTAAARLVTRAQIALMAAAGGENQTSAAELGVAIGTVRENSDRARLAVGVPQVEPEVGW